MFPIIPVLSTKRTSNTSEIACNKTLHRFPRDTTNGLVDRSLIASETQPVLQS